MSYQSEIHCKMAIFNPKSHAPETSEGSESASILLVRIFFICQATFPSFDILSLALAERGFRGGLEYWKYYLHKLEDGLLWLLPPEQDRDSGLVKVGGHKVNHLKWRN